MLALCRLLIAAGHEPDQPLEVYRGDMLALRVRTIGEGANLEMNSKAAPRSGPGRPYAARRCAQGRPVSAALTPGGRAE